MDPGTGVKPGARDLSIRMRYEMARHGRVAGGKVCMLFVMLQRARVDRDEHAAMNRITLYTRPRRLEVLPVGGRRSNEKWSGACTMCEWSHHLHQRRHAQAAEIAE